MLRRSNLLDINGNLINPATYETQVNGSQKTQIVDQYGVPYGSISTESGNARAVYQTNRTDAGSLHLTLHDLAIGSYKVIIIDISDTENYNHTETGYCHLEWHDVRIISDSVNTEWELSFGFLEEVGVDGSKFYQFNHWSGSKATGNNMDTSLMLFPAGPHLHSSKFTVAPPSITADFKSDQQERSVLSPLVANMAPGPGDVAMMLDVVDGPVKELKINMGWHSHDIPA